jgi:hypothetical protein
MNDRMIFLYILYVEKAPSLNMKNLISTLLMQIIKDEMYAILIHFHKFSIIVESMKFQLKKNESLISKLSNEYNDENNLKKKLIKNLEKVINQSEDENQILISENDLDLG